MFRRSDWSEVRKRTEMQRTGIYVLVGYRNEDDDLPTLYIGQADGVKGRHRLAPQGQGFLGLGRGVRFDQRRAEPGACDMDRVCARQQGGRQESLSPRQRQRAPGACADRSGESGKYKLVFSERAKPIGPIPYGDAPSGRNARPHATRRFSRLQKARKLTPTFLGKS